MKGSKALLNEVQRDGSGLQTPAAMGRIAFTKRQLEDIEGFKADLKANRAEFAFEGTMLETVTFLEGAKNVVESLSH